MQRHQAHDSSRRSLADKEANKSVERRALVLTPVTVDVLPVDYFAKGVLQAAEGTCEQRRELDFAALSGSKRL